MSAPESLAEKSARETWERRKTHQNIWTKNDTARWLDDRTLAGLVWWQAQGNEPSRRPIKAWGSWLKINHAGVFAIAHGRLARATDRTMSLAELLARKISR
jgi:hypothetical protein